MSTNVIYPAFSYINDISNAVQAIVTFTADHDFIVGEILGFRVTPPFGMFEINNRHGKVLSITSDTVTVDIDTTFYTAFDYSALNSRGTTPPVCVPAGSGVIPDQTIPQTSIDDAFDNRRA